MFDGGVGEDFLGGGGFDEFAHVEERGDVGDSCGLVHVVGDDDDGDLLAEGFHQLFDFVGGDGIEGGAGLVHQQHFGFGGDGAGDAETLLLAAGEAKGGGVEAVFDFVPEAGGFEGFFDGFVEEVAFADAVDAEGK